MELTNGDVYMLNPVFRTEHGVPPVPAVAAVNLPLTRTIRIGFGLCLLFAVLLFGRKRRIRLGLGRSKTVLRASA